MMSLAINSWGGSFPPQASHLIDLCSCNRGKCYTPAMKAMLTSLLPLLLLLISQECQVDSRDWQHHAWVHRLPVSYRSLTLISHGSHK